MILAIESSSVCLSCAICENDVVLSSFSIATGLKHSQTLMVLVDDMFKTARVSLKELKAVAVSIGPGSFTGLRVGLAAAKGISFGLKLPCVGVETLRALAYNLVYVKGLICPVIDARRNTVYTALYRSDGEKIVQLKEDYVEEIEKLKDSLKEEKEAIFFVGDASKSCFEVFKGMNNVFLAPNFLRMPSAVSVAFLAFEKIRSNCDLNEKVVPKYLRLSQAERERQEKEKSN